LKLQWIFVILLSLFVIRNFRGTCSSAQMLEGYMGRERLGTSDIDHQTLIIAKFEHLRAVEKKKRFFLAPVKTFARLLWQWS